MSGFKVRYDPSIQTQSKKGPWVSRSLKTVLVSLLVLVVAGVWVWVGYRKGVGFKPAPIVSTVKTPVPSLAPLAQLGTPTPEPLPQPGNQPVPASNAGRSANIPQTQELNPLANPSAGQDLHPFLKQWGQQGKGPGQFQRMGGICVDDDKFVYVLESALKKVEKFDSEGNFIKEWPLDCGKCLENVSFDGIAVDRAGDLFIGDDWERKIQEFHTDGSLIKEWGGIISLRNQDQIEKADDPARNWVLIALSTDEQNHLYAMNKSTGKVEIYDKNGGHLGGWQVDKTGEGSFFHPFGIAVGEKAVYLNFKRKVLVCDRSGKLLDTWDLADRFKTSGPLCLDPKGNLYIAESESPNIQEYDPKGNLLWKVQLYEKPESPDNSWPPTFRVGVFGPQGIAVDKDGFIYVADTDNYHVLKFGPQLSPNPPSADTLAPERKDDGHFLTKASQISPEQGVSLIDEVGDENCRRFVNLAAPDQEDLLDAYLNSDQLKRINLNDKNQVIQNLRKYHDVKGEEIWEGLKEIDRLTSQVLELEGQIYSDMGRLDHLGSQGMFEDEQEGKINPDEVQADVSDTTSDMGEIQKQIGDKYRTMNLVAALVLIQVSENLQNDVLDTLEQTLKGIKSNSAKPARR